MHCLWLFVFRWQERYALFFFVHKIVERTPSNEFRSQRFLHRPGRAHGIQIARQIARTPSFRISWLYNES